MARPGRTYKSMSKADRERRQEAVLKALREASQAYDDWVLADVVCNYLPSEWRGGDGLHAQSVGVILGGQARKGRCRQRVAGFRSEYRAL